MITSKLNNSIKYYENRDILKHDINQSFELHEYNLFGIDIHIVIGIKNEDHIESNILFFPVYLTLNEKFISQIGLFEIKSQDLDKHLDEEGDIRLDTLEDLILYNFVSKEFISGVYNTKLPKSDSPIEEQPEYPVKTFTTEANWVNTYLKETNFKIIDQPGDGHCFFSAIQMAFSDKYTVEGLRSELSKIVDSSQFETYKILYDSNQNELSELKKLKTTYDSDIAKFKSDSKLTKDKAKLSKILKEAKKSHSELKKVKVQLQTETYNSTEYAFMRDVKTMEDLRAKILTCGFWADAWAIDKIEELLNIKLIILSSDNYESGQLNKIIQCPEKKDIERVPEHYVIVDHTGNHYKLVTFNDNKLFNFSTIPDSLKKKIVDTCMTGSVGSFHEINDFIKYSSSI